jgi:hypothetical protein
MTTAEAIEKLREIERECPDIRVKVLTMTDVFDIAGLGDEFKPRIRSSYAWKHWSRFNDYDAEEISSICVEVECNS